MDGKTPNTNTSLLRMSVKISLLDPLKEILSNFSDVTRDVLSEIDVPSRNNYGP
jgi:hypothetical protein